MRSSGILLPIFSLPGDYGIGTLGSAAYNFVDFLDHAGQRYWQILPLNPTSYGNSPYQSPSVFAGNPYFIDPDILVSEGLITERDASAHRSKNTGTVNYSELFTSRLSLIKKAAEGIDSNDTDLLSFAEKNSFWLGDYAAFMTLKEENRMLPFEKWKIKAEDISSAEQKSMLHCKIQFLFFRQWIALKKYANNKGIHIIGDLPIYPSRDSSDYYFGRDSFLSGVVAACPPDDFNANGQLWGNPVYSWDKMENNGFSWWKERLQQAASLFDTVRIDHFRGIYEYYTVAEHSPTAIDGAWHKGPGMKFVNMIKENFPTLDIIAEDLGFLSDDVKAFFRKCGFDGMKILQFAFGGNDSEYLPHNCTPDFVAYTGTHDNPTVTQWLCSAPRSEVIKAMDYLGVHSAAQLCSNFIRGVLSSVCRRAIIPLPDWLGLGCIGRINTPGTVGNNWKYRVNERELSDNLAERILYYTKLYNREKE